MPPVFVPKAPVIVAADLYIIGGATECADLNIVNYFLLEFHHTFIVACVDIGNIKYRSRCHRERIGELSYIKIISRRRDLKIDAYSPEFIKIAFTAYDVKTRFLCFLAADVGNLRIKIQILVKFAGNIMQNIRHALKLVGH